MTPASPQPVTVTPVTGLPEVRQGDHLAGLVVSAVRAQALALTDGDIVVVSSKVVSKALGLTADASTRASVIVAESRRVVAERTTADGVTQVVEALAGPVMAAAGVDASNTGADDRLLLLPRDPDGAARLLHAQLVGAWQEATGTEVSLGVVISDTAGRPWRTGQVDFALGAAGVRLVEDLRGNGDADGRALSVTERCVGDEIAAAADLVKGKVVGVPVALVRGLGHHVEWPSASPTAPGAPAEQPPAGASALVRVGPQDWFALGSAEAVRSALGVTPGTARARAVGLPSVLPERETVRADRALAVALLDVEGVTGCVDGDVVTLRGADAFDLGVAATRLRVALRGEGLDAALERDDARGEVRVRLT